MFVSRWFQKFRAWVSRCFPAKPRVPLAGKMRTGVHGEDLATTFLRKIGWKIVVRNWREGRDELDIVARDGKTLVFVEVKTRTARESAPAASLASCDTGAYEAVDARKRHALSRAIRAYLLALPPPVPPHRFDIIEVILHPSGSPPPEIRHHKHIPLSTGRRR